MNTTISYKYSLQKVDSPAPDPTVDPESDSIPEQQDHYQFVVTSLQQEGWSMPIMMTWTDVQLLHTYLQDKIRANGAVAAEFIPIGNLVELPNSLIESLTEDIE